MTTIASSNGTIRHSYRITGHRDSGTGSLSGSYSEVLKLLNLYFVWLSPPINFGRSHVVCVRTIHPNWHIVYTLKKN